MALEPIQMPTPSTEGAQLEQIASSLLIKAEGHPPDPAPEPEVSPEPTDDGQTEVPEPNRQPDPDDDPGEPPAADEAQEERQLKSDDGDAEEFHRVKVNGQILDVNLEELKRGYSGQSAIRAGNEHVAAKRKEAETLVTQAIGIRDRYAKTLEQALAQQAQDDDDPEIDWDGLKAADQDEWGRQRELQRERREKRATKAASILSESARIAKERTAQRQIQDDAYLERQANIIREHLPVLADPKTGPPLRLKLEEHAKKFGFTPETLAKVNDAVTFRLLHSSMMAEEGQDQEQVEQVRRKQLKPRIRPGRAQAPASRASRQQKRMDRDRQTAKETGHVDDVAKTLMI